ncbi:MAG: hypothetical protein IPN71_08330 [Fibrobacteres bacterium]|nr:hypothetical protein [Fibrobacterota bacterium]
MSASTRSSRTPGWLFALTALTALVSCQETPVAPKEEETHQVNLRFQEPAAALRPDSISWQLGGESARAAFAAEADHPEAFRAWFDLPRPLGKDTIKLSTWRYGMRTSVLPYAGEGPSLDDPRIVRDQLARDLLIRHQSKNTSDAKAYPADPAGVRRVYAECLLSGEAMCPHAPPVRPVGMDSLGLVNELCRELARRKLPFVSQIPAPFFGWTQDRWREVVVGRIQSGMLTAQDSATLFPAQPKDTVVKNPRTDSIAPRIRIASRYFDPTGDSLRTRLTWIVTDNDTVDSVRIEGVYVPQVGNTYSRYLMLDSGNRYIHIEAVDRSGNRSIDSTLVPAFPDSIAPVLTALPGTVSRAVPSDSMSILVAWRASDNRSVKTVRIQDSVVVGQGGVYATQVPLAMGKNVIRVKAIDPSGNQTTDSIVVERRDAQGPRLRRITPSGSDTTLDEASDTLEAIWEVTDPSGLDTVEIDGKPVTKNGDRYSSRGEIPYGKSRMRIRAVDSDGHLAQDSILVERIDRTAPHLSLKGPRDTAVESGTDSIQVSWQAEDNWGVKRLEIDRVETRGVSGVYGRKIPLAFGWNMVVVQATDSAGNAARDSARIYRPSIDGLRLYRDLPTLADSVVADSVTSISVAYFASSPVRIDTVSINGQWTQLDATGEARRDVRLTTGPNRIPVMAVDRDKNRRVDTVKVYRRDQTPPALVRQAGTTSKSVDSAQTSITLAWLVSDNYAVKQVRINGAVVSSSTGIYSQTVNLGYGTNHFTVVAFDSAGNYKADTILIKRDSMIVSVPTLSRVRLARLELPGSRVVAVSERRALALVRGAKRDDLS